MNRKRKWLNVPFLRADTHRPSPPTCFWAANSTNSSSKCSRDDLASRSQICKNCIIRVGHGFESRRCHKNFTKKTFFAISKNVKYRSVACLWPKLWAFWVLQLSYNCTTVCWNPELLQDRMTARLKEAFRIISGQCSGEGKKRVPPPCWYLFLAQADNASRQAFCIKLKAHPSLRKTFGFSAISTYNWSTTRNTKIPEFYGNSNPRISWPQDNWGLIIPGLNPGILSM